VIMDRHCPFSPFDFDYNSGSFITDSEPSSVHLKQIDQTLAFRSQPRYPQIMLFLKKFMPVPAAVSDDEQIADPPSDTEDRPSSVKDSFKRTWD
jgi:hypothetical protein